LFGGGHGSGRRDGARSLHRAGARRALQEAPVTGSLLAQERDRRLERAGPGPRHVAAIELAGRIAVRLGLDPRDHQARSIQGETR